MDIQKVKCGCQIYESDPECHEGCTLLTSRKQIALELALLVSMELASCESSIQAVYDKWKYASNMYNTHIGIELL